LSMTASCIKRCVVIACCRLLERDETSGRQL
jgi:hypothetical protein